ncbi:hypothetical protein B0T20DRAFT_391090 [Sordaria brevicollis]|uniref:Uncharacterized protein n=1 Tax=Sordaria brevicollis TaxID=83679 RepID=A0AAE0UF93_SORBR|nr:hypothetical protein B0T20DRAFT_391090 [Sordaria brevicollis]
MNVRTAAAGILQHQENLQIERYIYTLDRQRSYRLSPPPHFTYAVIVTCVTTSTEEYQFQDGKSADKRYITDRGYLGSVGRPMAINMGHSSHHCRVSKFNVRPLSIVITYIPIVVLLKPVVVVQYPKNRIPRSTSTPPTYFHADKDTDGEGGSGRPPTPSPSASSPNAKKKMQAKTINRYSIPPLSMYSLLIAKSGLLELQVMGGLRTDRAMERLASRDASTKVRDTKARCKIRDENSQKQLSRLAEKD